MLKRKSSKILLGASPKAKQSPRKSRSLKTLEKMVVRTPSRSPNRTRSASRSSSGTISIDRDIIDKAKKEIKEENALRKKFNIPKDYKDYKLEDIPLRVLKKKRSPKRKNLKKISQYVD